VQSSFSIGDLALAQSKLAASPLAGANRIAYVAMSAATKLGEYVIDNSPPLNLFSENILSAVDSPVTSSKPT
jgi:hypothetical protein